MMNFVYTSFSRQKVRNINDVIIIIKLCNYNSRLRSYKLKVKLKI